ncbi:hypothetical protein PHJA_000537700 [Phtheirospermum japonicum]|uniref:Uncharacterized protein n=1 Tax=Phtheirospermum japonicum TaxID=374723 RepID=A0A830BPL1_9LAMI|nr:hypothetical protein PHJA_000191500 [Phtheirospermum japonicum]GFP83941.1 hypothetical protein PHJA_000537700 [Phtheirospermum japonicum]
MWFTTVPFAILVLLILAEVTSLCQAKVFDVLSPPFYALYFVVGGFLGPYFVYRMFAFYMSGADDTVIPRWVWVGFRGFSWL